MLVGVSASLGVEMVLSPFMWGWLSVGASAFLGLEVASSPFMWRWVLVGAFALLGLERSKQRAAQFGQSLHQVLRRRKRHEDARKTLNFETLSLSGCGFLK